MVSLRIQVLATSDTVETQCEIFVLFPSVRTGPQTGINWATVDLVSDKNVCCHSLYNYGMEKGNCCTSASILSLVISI